MRRQIASILLLLLALSAPVRAQNLYEYDFSTGVDSSKWMPLTQPVSLLRPYSIHEGYLHGTGSYPTLRLGFNLWMLGTDATTFGVHRSGRMVLNHFYAFEDYRNFRMAVWSDSNYLMPYGVVPDYDSSGSVAYQIFGTPDSRSRILVCEFALRVNLADTELSRYQIQLFEANSAIRFVYAPRTSTRSCPALGQIGIARNREKFISVRPDRHTAAANDDYAPFTLPWPGNWRYYEFNPRCAGMTRLTVDNVDFTSARIYWDTFATHDHYLIEYGAPSVGDTGHRFQSATDTFHLSGLLPATLYEVRVRAVCANGDTSPAFIRTFTTLIPACSNIPFTNIFLPFAECRIGHTVDPDQSDRLSVVDNGPASEYSRHTVHTDTAERDPRTGGQLRTIPPGHCASVRLGNWRWGGERESITYHLPIDTLDYDLLVLRYALVEQNPNHGEQVNPKFIFSIEDSLGNPIDSCHYANFVSGDSSGWNQVFIANQEPVLWRDWEAVGVDVAPFHGQTLRVRLYNSDCAAGGHYGYSYFTLEDATKHFSTTSCGTNAENTFRAPQGFSYRWYNAADTATTLSTADTLRVTMPGSYRCWLSYKLAGRDCGITMSTRAGPRYPVARFTFAPEDTCAAVLRFFNQSVIATDAAHTHLTSEPCEKYLWRFDDGTTDTTDNPVHAFVGGQHAVTLVAMLAGGDCVDSVTHIFRVSLPTDTLSVTVCPGSRTVFDSRLITDTGYYSSVEECIGHVLHYAWHPTTNSLWYDTICAGDTLHFGPYACTDSGFYTYTLTDIHGCDSTFSLQLYCDPNPYQHITDTLPVGGIYSYGDTSFVAPGHYSFRRPISSGCDILYDIDLSCRLGFDTTVCVSTLPVEWGGHTFTGDSTATFTYPSRAGTDSIVDYTLHVRPQAVLQYHVDQSCEADGYFIVQFIDSNRHRLLSLPPDTAMEEVEEGRLYHLRPGQKTRYFLCADYGDAPSCASVDSVEFNPADLVGMTLDFTYSPEEITSDHTQLTLIDRSRHVYGRQWYVDSTLLPETGFRVRADIPAAKDSFTVCLVGHRSYCADTLCMVIPIRRHEVWFPNVFTPDEEENNRFRAEGVNVEGFELWIYDRRGVQMFHATDMTDGWDGTCDGIVCSQGTYAYVCHYIIPGKQIRSKAGTVTLLR